ncbi:hypothetical protein SAMN04488556_0279 [Halostagnicola kamekurae]|uniref:Uncharacterized protein n=1 Tax=Halostagnicola kamekurae TaxID=619731 RepID=A0A1I6P2I9_9EURY|nr:hypothetical protein SAMN04488556_0279 [Halostagnicola kamekurae]
MSESAERLSESAGEGVEISVASVSSVPESDIYAGK